MRIIILGVVLLSLIPALTILASGPGTRFGVWEYGTGLGLIRQMALPAIMGAGATLIAFFVSLFTARALAPLALIATAFVGVAAYVPIKMKQLVDANPFIHDITTDFDNPPVIAAAAALERKNPPQYVGDEPAPRSELSTAEAQRQAFPELQHLVISGSLDGVTDSARGVINAMGMEILADAQTGDVHVIEAADTSLWFGFVDDFIVRLTPTDGGVRVDVRSKSRVGASDLGANAQRILTFLEKLESAS